MLSITEMSNALTEDIDIADAPGILRILQQTDSQIFGAHGSKGIRDEQFLSCMERACDFLSCSIVESVRNREHLKVIFSGAGTSGRLAMLLAETCNDLYSAIDSVKFDFLIAGGIRALVQSQEGAEDDPKQGIEDLETRCSAGDRFIYIGITCGLSAQYVSGQLYHTISEKKQPAILVGFNPVENARTTVPENWNKSFSDVLRMVQGARELFILNPIIGPEPITGSTRMKGGTATKIILETLLYTAFRKVSKEFGLKNDVGPFPGDDFETASMIMMLFDRYASTVDMFYDYSDQLSPILRQAGDTLNLRGHLTYLGEGVAGKWGIIDASECPPTFGADIWDVKGFIPGGWGAFCTLCVEPADEDDGYAISLENFKMKHLPHLTEKDLTIMTGTAAFFDQHHDLIASMEGTSVRRIMIDPAPVSHRTVTDLDMVISGAEDWNTFPIFTSTILKLLYNTMTSAAHVFKGKVFQNKMIDLRISNNKLYHRAVHIIQELMKVDAYTAEDALLRAIYGTDRVMKTQRSAPVSSHIQETIGREAVVPVALLLSTGRFNVRDARTRVEQEHIVRNIIQSVPES